MPLPRNPDRKAIQDLLTAVKGKDSSFAVNMTVLRSFEKAQYAPLNIGHFALASTHYCHFTSPIRRYADLLVHRLLEYYLQNRLDLAKGASAELDLTGIGKHITFTEQRADDAEHELKTVLILQMLSGHIGEEFDCVVTGLTNFGVFVQLRKFGIEGLVQIYDLGDDVWEFDKKIQCITGMNSGATIHLGRKMKVRIASVNIPARQLNVTPAELLFSVPKRGRKNKITKRAGKDLTQRRSKRSRRNR